ncbi:hypothetical protein LTS10_005188 [Elasticomyces elasticus]|nr:hypothetical protein LTS10_005188 [Elasticomyces elasticus]
MCSDIEPMRMLEADLTLKDMKRWQAEIKAEIDGVEEIEPELKEEMDARAGAGKSKSPSCAEVKFVMWIGPGLLRAFKELPAGMFSFTAVFGVACLAAYVSAVKVLEHLRWVKEAWDAR